MAQFQSMEGARRYLSGSLISLNGSPVYIEQVDYVEHEGNDFRYAMRGFDIITGDPLRTELTEVFIPGQKMQLGYCNQYELGMVAYLTRYPSRQVRIGITQDSIVKNWPTDQEQPLPTLRRLVRMSEFHDMLNNTYPSIQEIEGIGVNQAFSRSFALIPLSLKTYSLHYKNNPIGEYSDNTFTIYQQHAFVADTLRRVLEEKGETKYDVQHA